VIFSGSGSFATPVSNPLKSPKKQTHRMRREAEEDVADRFIMRLPPLGLLQGGMRVAEAALARAVVEDRRRVCQCAAAPDFWTAG
jgi:hypothetical protein